MLTGSDQHLSTVINIRNMKKKQLYPTSKAVDVIKNNMDSEQINIWLDRKYDLLEMWNFLPTMLSPYGFLCFLGVPTIYGSHLDFYVPHMSAEHPFIFHIIPYEFIIYDFCFLFLPLLPLVQLKFIFICVLRCFVFLFRTITVVRQ